MRRGNKNTEPKGIVGSNKFSIISNGETSKFCDKCGAILDINTAVDFEKQKNNEKNILHMFVQKIVDENLEVAGKALSNFPKEMLKKLKKL